MKLKMMSPEDITAIVVAVILFGIGIYAVFSVQLGVSYASPSPTSGSYYMYSFNTNGSTATTAHIWNNNCSGTSYNGRIWISIPGYKGNDTTTLLIEMYYKNTSTWQTVQAVGAANGTIVSGNSTYRVAPGTHVTLSTGRKDCSWGQAWRVSYLTRDPVKSQPYLATNNASQISNNVFNIVGIILIVGAIMLIVGIVYSYVRPGGFGGILPPAY